MASEQTAIQCEECCGVRQECDCPDLPEWPPSLPTVSEMEQIVAEDDRIYAERNPIPTVDPWELLRDLLVISCDKGNLVIWQSAYAALKQHDAERKSDD